MMVKLRKDDPMKRLIEMEIGDHAWFDGTKLFKQPFEAEEFGSYEMKKLVKFGFGPGRYNRSFSRSNLTFVTLEFEDERARSNQ